MASTKEYLTFILEQLSGGGIYDNRFLVKPVNAAKALMPQAPFELPYAGAKEMLLVEDPEDREFLAQLLSAMEPELPAPKKRK